MYRMTDPRPEPLVPAEVDCTDLDGFVLNVERLMASELVALSTHEEVAAALFLWCRAWKQRPTASLPDDERIIAAFARMTVAKFHKVRDQAMHGFVLCSDGRWYHRVLAAEALRAFGKKTEFRRKREADADRLRKWREGRNETASETRSETPRETHDETRFVQTVKGQGQVRDREEEKNEKNISRAPKRARSKDPLNGHAKDFETFWNAYPKRVGKGAAIKAYARALTKADAPVILDGARRYALSRRDEDPEYTAHPSTWLNGERWLDEAPLSDAPVPDPALEKALAAEREFKRKHGDIE